MGWISRQDLVNSRTLIRLIDHAYQLFKADLLTNKSVQIKEDLI